MISQQGMAIPSSGHCWHFFIHRIGSPKEREFRCCHCGTYKHQRMGKPPEHGRFAPDDWLPLPADRCSSNNGDER